MRKSIIIGLTAITMLGTPAAAMASNPNPDCQGNPHLCDNGTPGPQGPKGDTGASAYDVWKAAGNTGTVQDFIKSLVGKQGAQGDQGIQGPDGIQGVQGIQGVPGKDGLTPTFVAIDKMWLGPNGGYAIYLGNEWVGLLFNGANGADGQNGVTPHIGENGNWFIGDNDTGITAQGPKGDDGLTPVFVPIAANADWGFPAGGYAIYLGDNWVANVYNGLNGTNGTDGKDGENGHDGHDGQNGIDGTNGTNGVDGTNGVNGQDGVNGTNGIDGAAGATGQTGAAGTTTIIRQPVSIKIRYAGQSVRTLHVFAPKHAKLTHVRVTMRGQRVAVRGGKFLIDLRGKSVGVYNINIRATYRTSHGKHIVIRSTRSLSVAMAGVTIS
jgi:Collagen triple helix repeat (20 copies)